MMPSLRIRLLLLLGASILAVTSLQFIVTLRAATQQADKLFDYHMQQIAFALQDSGFDRDGAYDTQGAEQIGFDFVIQIWSDDGARVYQSRPYRALPAQGKLGYSNVTLGNGEWRMYATRNDDLVIQVAQKLDTRRERAVSLALYSVWPILPAASLLFAAVWWVITSALQPLNRIGRELANRHPGSLDPVVTEGVPREVASLVGELNALLERTGRALRSQQDFVADAAHELRSPLTALKLQLRTLATSRNDTEREQALIRLQGGTDRAARLVEQLLTLARQDPFAEPCSAEPIPFQQCVGQALSDVAALAASKGVQMDYQPGPAVGVLGAAEDLRVLVRNLADNAIRYSPPNSTVRVEVLSDDARVTLRVIDAGPGIPATLRARVFDRFFRVPGTAPTGSGLGLAIAKAIAERHQASLELRDASPAGLEVRVSIPRHEEAGERRASAAAA
jgi:two-component system, OmpR family, sensor kinase